MKTYFLIQWHEVRFYKFYSGVCNPSRYRGCVGQSLEFKCLITGFTLSDIRDEENGVKNYHASSARLSTISHCPLSVSVYLWEFTCRRIHLTSPV